MELKFTKKGNSYWNDSGIYQKEYDELYKKLVPAQGKAETLNGELLRAIGILYYEYCNNGNCNAFNGISEYDEVFNEEICIDKTIKNLYRTFLSLIKNNVPNIKLNIEKIENIIINRKVSEADYFSHENMQIYNEMCDRVIYYVLTTENQIYKN